MLSPNITYIDTNEYLHVKVSGSNSDLETALQYWNEIIIECAGKEHSKLLVERDFPTQLDVFDMKTLVRKIAALTLRFNIKLAFVENKISRPGVNEYGVNAVKSYGATAQIFESTHEAKNWLLNIQ